MYIQPHFAQTQPEHLHRIMRTHPLGALVTSGPEGLDADHIPFEFDPGAGPLGTLSAHVARANPLWQRCPSGTAVMVIFCGAEAYVSPNWYPSKHKSHRQWLAGARRPEGSVLQTATASVDRTQSAFAAVSLMTLVQRSPSAFM